MDDHSGVQKEGLADDSDDEKKIIRVEARARSQAKQNIQKAKSRFALVRRAIPNEKSTNLEQLRYRFQLSSETYFSVRRVKSSQVLAL